MMYAVKRLWLGVSLIAVASAILLVADIDRRASGTTRAIRLAILQHVESTLMEDGVRGVMESLAARGYRHNEGGVTIDRFNAQGDMATSVAIANQLVGGGYDLVITSSTPSMQAVANANREGKTRHVFALVADPFASGVGLDRGQPLAHPRHMVGQGSFPPVDVAFEYARTMLPSLARVGVAWNPAESNSLAFVQRGRDVAKRMGLTLLEANADSTAAVNDAVNSLIARDAQAIWVGGDNTIAAAIDSVIAVARRNRVPVFSVLPGPPDRGSLFDTGFDFVEVGRQTGQLAADVLGGADMTAIPIVDVGEIVQPYLSINSTILDGLREPWRIPDDLLKRANVVVDRDGIHRRGADPAAKPAAANRPLPKRWRVQFIQLNQALDVDEVVARAVDIGR
jgi:putative ABC transport system substrate-binding protein